jgi:hypothetical protein
MGVNMSSIEFRTFCGLYRTSGTSENPSLGQKSPDRTGRYNIRSRVPSPSVSNLRPCKLQHFADRESLAFNYSKAGDRGFLLKQDFPVLNVVNHFQTESALKNSQN